MIKIPIYKAWLGQLVVNKAKVYTVYKKEKVLSASSVFNRQISYSQATQPPELEDRDEVLVHAQRKATKLVKGLECKSHEE